MEEIAQKFHLGCQVSKATDIFFKIWGCTLFGILSHMYTSGGWKIQKMVKISWLSVKKMCIWCEKFQKKFGLNWRFSWRAPAKTCSLGFGSAICPLHVIFKAICGPKKFHPVCLTFDPLGLQMTTTAQNDWNLLRILNFWVKYLFKLKMDQF